MTMVQLYKDEGRTSRAGVELINTPSRGHKERVGFRFDNEHSQAILFGGCVVGGPLLSVRARATAPGFH